MEDSMTHSPMLSKERRQELPSSSEDEEPSDYYYDDSTGYRIYDPDKEDEDPEADEPEE